jgi:DNA-binding Lrp family transcriptional regulator
VPSAYVLINCELGSENEVIEKIRKIPEVVEIYRLFGVYDIIVKFSINDKETIKEIIAWKIKNLDKIRSVLSMIVTENVEND